MPCLCLRRKFKPLKQAARNFVTCGAFNSAVATSHSSFTYTYEMADNPDTITCFPGALSAARLPHQQVSLLLCKQMTGISSPPPPPMTSHCSHLTLPASCVQSLRRCFGGCLPLPLLPSAWRCLLNLLISVFTGHFELLLAGTEQQSNSIK